jgi:PBP1b-binding outer membrane lipoprotein LpoB
MKNRKITLSVLAIAFILSSCSITKRTYSDGYHVEWYHRNHKQEKPTADQKTADPQETLVEAVSAPETTLTPEEDHTLTAGASESSPIKENKRSSADHSNKITTQPILFVKESVKQFSKQAAQVKEKSSNKAMGILSSFVILLLTLALIVLVIFVISVLL